MTADGPGAKAQVRGILVAGLIDSLGLSLGWTTFLLIAVAREGLVAAGLYNAAMFVGMVLSAPITSWCANRIGGRAFLTLFGAAEAILRIGSLAALLVAHSPYVVAALVALMNIATWSGYAGMRAEIAAVSLSTRSMTNYAVGITAIEAAGTTLAALLPVLHGTQVRLPLVLVVMAVYGASLVPQFWCARNSRVVAGRAVLETPDVDAVQAPRIRRLAVLVSGGVVMLLASGPATLSTPLADELGGHVGVVLSAIAVCLGSLGASVASLAMGRLGRSTHVRWTAWGVLMVVGWIVAPWNLAGLFAAQFVAACAMTALQGDMDTVVAGLGPPGRATSYLAWSTSARAGGSAVAARVLPLLVVAPQIGRFGLVVTALLVVGGSAVTLARRTVRARVLVATEQAGQLTT